MTRGDVLLVQLPPPGGREPAGRRPAVAVQTDTADADFPTLMSVPFTSKLSALRYPRTIQVDPSSANGLTQPSVLSVFQLRAIDRKRILKKIGELEQHYLDRLDAEIKRLLNIG